MKHIYLETLFQHVETLQKRKLYQKTRMLTMSCVPRKVLPVSRYKWQVLKTKYKEKYDFRN